MARLLIFRFSALGDIAMTVPVIDSLARQHPETRITVVSRPFAAPLFASLPNNVHFVGADLKGRHKGLPGLWRLARELRRNGRCDVADLHDVLRTKVLRRLLRLSGCRTAHIRKGRYEKRRLANGTERRQLTTSFERYAEVFRRLGYPFAIDFRKVNITDYSACDRAYGPQKADEPWIGIAPTAAHAGKTYPPERMLKAVGIFCHRHPQARVFVFGSRTEADLLRTTWQQALPNVTFVCDALHGFGEELQLMARLNVMVSMDSGNMHLASLAGVPVISIWGQTHPYAGFMGYGQTTENAVQADLRCRPCSIFGNRPCRYGPYPYPCLTGIRPEQIADKLEAIPAHH